MNAELTQSKHLEVRPSILVVSHLERFTKGRLESGFTADLFGTDMEAMCQERELPRHRVWRSGDKEAISAALDKAFCGCIPGKYMKCR